MCGSICFPCWHFSMRLHLCEKALSAFCLSIGVESWQTNLAFHQSWISMRDLHKYAGSGRHTANPWAVARRLLLSSSTTDSQGVRWWSHFCTDDLNASGRFNLTSSRLLLGLTVEGPKENCYVARKRLLPARKRLQPARKRLQPDRKSLQPARKKFQPARKKL